jgi:asparagine synthase (glutamine-hydrolysing)
MNAIAGIVNVDGAPVDREWIWVDGNVGFSRQPFTLDDNIWLVADARIDGAGQLSDEEAILRAYEKSGADCVEQLIGDFAFVVWDQRLRRLFCARDHFGVKPCFYAHIGNSFIFSNSLNGLRRDQRVSDELNETAVGDYLALGLNQDLSSTIFHDIQRLPAGHTLSLANGVITTRRYWAPAVKNEIRFRDPQSYVGRFNELVVTAIKDRLRTNRVSISMSGGLDSTSLAAVVRELLPEPSAVHGFSNVYDKLIPDEERYYSTLAASHIGIPIHHNVADKYELFDESRPGDLNQPEPFLISPFSGQFHDLLRLMAANGGVALTGYDGDALLNEPRRHSYARRKANQLKAWLKGKPAEEFSYPTWLDESFARRINLVDRVRNAWLEPTGIDRRRPAALHALQSKVWAPLFEGYDSSATRLALEVRHPFIDVRLVDYVLSIPADPWCVNKHLLRCAMKDRLPAAVLNRPKSSLAGNPALQLSRRASVRWLDNFEASPQLNRFVNLSLRRSLTEEKTPDALWANLRLFAFNHWLTHSLRIDRRLVA